MIGCRDNEAVLKPVTVVLNRSVSSIDKRRKTECHGVSRYCQILRRNFRSAVGGISRGNRDISLLEPCLWV